MRCYSSVTARPRLIVPLLLCLSSVVYILKIDGIIRRPIENLLERTFESQTQEPESIPSKTEDINVIPENSTSCSCLQIPWPESDVYKEELERPLDWLNMTYLEHLRKHHPNFPASLFSPFPSMRAHLMPAPHEMPWANRYWQVLDGKETKYFLYSAFIDNRRLTKNAPVIRILTETDSVDLKLPYCYIWFNITGPPLVSPTKMHIIRNNGRTGERQMPHMLTCGVSKQEGYRKPLAVSLVEQPCMKAHNLLEVVGAMERDKDTTFREGHSNSDPKFAIAACTNAVYFYNNDFSYRFAEWIETLKAIGFSSSYIPSADVSPNLNKLYAYYEKKGMLGFTKHYYPEPGYNEPSLRRVYARFEPLDSFGNDPILYSDCLLRRMHKYRFIAHLDLDEIFLMRKQDSFLDWLDTVIKTRTLSSSNPPTYRLEMWPHTDDIPPASAVETFPEYLYALRHSKKPVEWVIGLKLRHKCIFDMDTVLAVDAHAPVICTTGDCVMIDVPRTVGHTGHFSSDKCGHQCQIQGGAEEIKFLYHYKEEIQKAVSETLRKLHVL